MAEKASRVYDPVNHPQHYTAHPSGIEVIELTRRLPFGPGNAVKYVLRRDQKGRAIEDIDKALWYLADSAQNNVSYVVTPEMENVARLITHGEPDPMVQEFLAARG